MERRRDLDRREHVERWRKTVPIGANSAHFSPGDEMRCPRTLTTERETRPTICGGYLGDAEASLTVYMVRWNDKAPQASIARQRCSRCEGYYRLCAAAEQIKGAA